MRVLPAATRLLLAAAAGCAATPAPADLSTPRDAVLTFQRAFARDDRAAEYACFSESVKRRFGNFLGYSIGSDALRRDHPLLVKLLGWADLEERLRTEVLPGGRRARARIDAGGDRRIEFELVYEPRYVLVRSEERVEEGFARAMNVRVGAGWLWLELLDPALTGEGGPVERVEIHPRWVIDDLPGLDAAVERARENATAAAPPPRLDAAGGD